MLYWQRPTSNINKSPAEYAFKFGSMEMYHALVDNILARDYLFVYIIFRKKNCIIRPLKLFDYNIVILSINDKDGVPSTVNYSISPNIRRLRL